MVNEDVSNGNSPWAYNELAGLPVQLPLHVLETEEVSQLGVQLEVQLELRVQ
jgi:hypothetical protein